MADQVNIADLIGRGELAIKQPEHQDERRARLIEENRKNLLDICKEIVIFAIFTVVVLVTGSLCIYKIFFDTLATEEVRRWSQTLLTSLIAGAASFVAGRKIGSK